MRICIFGASGDAIDPVYMDETFAVGKALAERGHSLIFGGGSHGLMGAAARGFTAGKGKIVGVAPRFFDIPGVLYEACDEFVWPDSMRDRKKYMEDHADAFLVAPGGIGTYEEFLEVLTLKQLARHGKPIVLFNINGFFDKLTDLIAADTASMVNTKRAPGKAARPTVITLDLTSWRISLSATGFMLNESFMRGFLSSRA